MEWLRAHAHLSLIAFVAVLIVAGAFVVENRSPVAPSQTTVTWGGGLPISYQMLAPQSPQQVAQDLIQNENPATLALAPLASSSPQPPGSDSFNYASLFGELNANTNPATSSTANNDASAAISEAYEFIPTGLVATTTQTAQPMTADQKTFYDYGNDIGGEIQSFEELHTDQAQILKDQAEDRTDPTKAAALVSLGQSLASVGTYMQQMQDVPPQAQDLHNALAQSYLDIGAKLQMVAQAQSDADFVQAVETYDTSANTFVHNYAALAQFFSEQGVTFSQQDPGSVFSFSDTSGAGGL